MDYPVYNKVHKADCAPETQDSLLTIGHLSLVVYNGLTVLPENKNYAAMSKIN